MTRAITTRLVQVGNSRGVRIPKTLLEQSGVRDQAELAVRGSSIVITPSKHVRQGWSQAFVAMARRGKDKLLDEAVVSADWDDRDWRW